VNVTSSKVSSAKGGLRRVLHEAHARFTATHQLLSSVFEHVGVEVDTGNFGAGSRAQRQGNTRCRSPRRVSTRLVKRSLVHHAERQRRPDPSTRDSRVGRSAVEPLNNLVANRFGSVRCLVTSSSFVFLEGYALGIRP